MSLEIKKVLTCIPAVFLCLLLRSALYIALGFDKVPFGSLLSYILCISIPISVVCKLWDKREHTRDQKIATAKNIASAILPIVHCIAEEPSGVQTDAILQKAPAYVAANENARFALSAFFKNAISAHEKWLESQKASASDAAKEEMEKYIEEATQALAPLFASAKFTDGDEKRWIEQIYSIVSA